MPEPTPVEKEGLDSFLQKADQLVGSKRGDINHLCEVVKDFSHLFVTAIAQGGVTPAECFAKHDQALRDINLTRSLQLKEMRTEIEGCIEDTMAKARDWKATLAWSLPLAAVVGGIGWKLVG